MKKLVVTWVLLLSALSAGTVNVHALSEEAQSNGLPSLAPMLEDVTPAVVNISTTQAARVPEQLQFLAPEDLRRFFNDREGAQPRPMPRGAVRATGSGVIVDADKGYVVTNHHVIDNAEGITVSLQDGREFKATLVGSDPSTDVALLKIEAESLQALEFADISNLRVGDYVVAIGNPFGIGQTVTSGIVSALGRGGLNNQNYEDFIQTDAAINVGNSGGALVDLEGNLIGINTAIISGSGSSAGIAFAVPVDMIAAVVEHLERDGEVRRGQLGVQIQDLNAAMESALRTGAGKGALVTSVLPGSAAEAAGIEVSDVIVAIDGRRIENSRELRNTVGLLRMNEEVELVLFRNGERQTVTAVIGGVEPTVAASAEGAGRDDSDPTFRGARLRSVEAASVRAAGVNGGVEVVEVDQQSPAWDAGLRPGDIIYEVNRSPVGSLREFNSSISESQPVIALGVLRENRRMLVVMS